MFLKIGRLAQGEGFEIIQVGTAIPRYSELNLLTLIAVVY